MISIKRRRFWTLSASWVYAGMTERTVILAKRTGGGISELAKRVRTAWSPEATGKGCRLPLEEKQLSQSSHPPGLQQTLCICLFLILMSKYVMLIINLYWFPRAHNESPPSRWLKTAENYPLTLLEARSSKSRCWQGCAPSGGSGRGDSSLPFPDPGDSKEIVGIPSLVTTLF